jgi:hypothetical protein
VRLEDFVLLIQALHERAVVAAYNSSQAVAAMNRFIASVGRAVRLPPKQPLWFPPVGTVAFEGASGKEIAQPDMRKRLPGATLLFTGGVRLAAALGNIALQPAQRELLEQAQSQLEQRGPGSAPHTPSAYLDALIASCGGDKQREAAMLLALKKLAKTDSGNQSYLLRGSRLLLAAVCIEAAEGGGGNGGSSPAQTAARSKLLHLLQRAEQLRPGAAGPALKLLSGCCKWVAARSTATRWAAALA